MPILNYTTKIEATKTVGEIQSLLAKHGAQKIMLMFDEHGEPESMIFEIPTAFGLRAVKLPAKWKAVLDVLKEQKIKCDDAQAKRVAWRIVKNWVEAQMAILETEMVSVDEVFLPYMIDNAGHTLYEGYLNGGIALLNN